MRVAQRGRSAAVALLAAGSVAVSGLVVAPGAAAAPTSGTAAVTSVAAAVANEDVTVKVAANGSVQFMLPEDVFRSTQRVMLFIDGNYNGETYNGRAYGLTPKVANGIATLTRAAAKGAKPGQLVEVAYVTGRPGFTPRYDGANVVASQLAPGSNDLAVWKGQSRLTVVPRGDANSDRIRENRWLQHNTLNPVGRYVTQGETFTVQVPAGVSMRIGIGQYGNYPGINGGETTKFDWHTITGTTTVTAGADGMINLVNEGTKPVFSIVYGGTPVPTFTLGKTTEAAFQYDLDRWKTAPLVLVQGERTVGVFQRATIDRFGLTTQNVWNWDDVVNRTDAFAGLSTTEAGLHHRSAARIYIANPLTGAGGASATHGRVTFQSSQPAAKKLFGPETGMWGFFHEVGHTYQVPQYMWKGTSEITVNISADIIQMDLGGPSTIENPKHQAAIADYLAMPESERDFNTSPSGARYAMFFGLTDAYGSEFYTKLNRVYREQAAAGTTGATDTASRQQHFMVTAGQVAQRNLTGYFQKWGLKPDVATKAALAKYPS
ncbi:M60 family metallopeptidase [Isoptericola sp. NPDC055881]